MRNGLRLVTLTCGPGLADVEVLRKGYAEVRGLLTVGGNEPFALVERCGRGGAFLRVLCGGRVSWRDVNDRWCSVVRGRVTVHRVGGAAVLAFLTGCEPLGG